MAFGIIRLSFMRCEIGFEISDAANTIVGRWAWYSHGFNSKT